MAIFCNVSFPIHHNKAFQRLLFLVFLFTSTVLQSNDLVPAAIADQADAPLRELDRASATETDLIRARSWLNKKSTSARVVSVNGDVLLFTSQDELAVALKKGMLLEMAAEVQTGINSAARFVFDDGSEVYLSASSLLRFKRLYRYGSTSIRDTQLFLQRGRITNHVLPLSGSTSRFEVVTPSAVTGVRGTEFRVSSDDDAKTWVEVLEGSVAVFSGGKEIAVPSGFATLAISGQEPVDVKQLLQAPDLSLIPDIHKGVIAFSLPVMTAAKSFRVQLSHINQVDILLLDDVFSDQSVLLENFSEGDYQLSIQAIDASGFEGRSASKNITLSAESNWLTGLLILGGILIVLL